MLGMAEAGFFPGVIVYLGHWFRYLDRAKAVAMFMTAIPISERMPCQAKLERAPEMRVRE